MAKKLTEKEMEDLTKKTGADLKETDTVKIKIPVDPLNPKDSHVPVGINGYNYIIERGKTVVVPEEVSKILENAGYI